MLLTVQLLAQTTAPPPPPCSGPEYRQFDVWLGEGDVFNPAGQKIGTNSITSTNGGCVLLDSWRDARHANADERRPGRRCDGAAVPAGVKPLNRWTWSKVAGGKVRQHAEQSTDDGKTWKTVFDGLYVKR